MFAWKNELSGLIIREQEWFRRQMCHGEEILNEHWSYWNIKLPFGIPE